MSSEENIKSEKSQKPEITQSENKSKVIQEQKVTVFKMSSIGRMENFLVGTSFTEYEMRLVQFFKVNKTEEDMKVASLITLVGPDAFSILRKMCAPDDPSTKSYNALVKVLKEYFDPSVNEISESYKFYQIEQGDSTINEYVMKLKATAENCDFGAFLQRALRDKFVFGLRDKHLRAKLLKEKDLTFKSAGEMALVWESAESANEKMSSNRISKVQQSSCFRCGRIHNPDTCPARNWECFTCHNKGHISTKCRSKANKSIKWTEEMSSSSENDQFEES